MPWLRAKQLWMDEGVKLVNKNTGGLKLLSASKCPQRAGAAIAPIATVPNTIQQQTEHEGGEVAVLGPDGKMSSQRSRCVMYGWPKRDNVSMTRMRGKVSRKRV